MPRTAPRCVTKWNVWCSGSFNIDVIWFCRIKVPGMTGYTYRPTRTSGELFKYRARKSTEITKGKAAQKADPTFGWLTDISKNLKYSS